MRFGSVGKFCDEITGKYLLPCAIIILITGMLMIF